MIKMTKETTNEQGFCEKIISEIHKEIGVTLNKVKKSVDNSSNPIYCLSMMNSIKKMYDNRVIPLLKECYLEDNSYKEVYVSRANLLHEMFNDAYQHASKRIDELGAPSSWVPSLLPKSLEKLTFPENN